MVASYARSRAPKQALAKCGFAGRRSGRQRLALDGDAMHFAPVAVVVVSGKVPGGAIIPERDRTGAPHEFMRELGPHAMRVELHERSEEHTSELQSRENLVCRLLLEKKKRADTG